MKATSQMRLPGARREFRRVGAACLLALSLGAAFSSRALCADEPPSPARDGVLAADAVVPEAKLTLEARRLPLSQVLAAVKQQTGAELTVAEGTFAREPKMTMAVSEMPLREWMESLAKLYDVKWQAAGPKSFQMKPSQISQGERGVRHMGSWFNAWAWPFEDEKRPKYLPPRVVPDWKGLVDNNLDLQAITTTGVPLAGAPAELQQAVRDSVQREVALRLLYESLLLNAAHEPLSLSVARPPGTSGYVLNPGRRDEKSFLSPNPVSVDVNSWDGKTVGRFDFRPPSRGRELLSEWALFPPEGMAPAQAAAAPQGEPEGGR